MSMPVRTQQKRRVSVNTRKLCDNRAEARLIPRRRHRLIGEECPARGSFSCCTTQKEGPSCARRRLRGGLFPVITATKAIQRRQRLYRFFLSARERRKRLASLLFVSAANESQPSRLPRIVKFKRSSPARRTLSRIDLESRTNSLESGSADNASVCKLKRSSRVGRESDIPLERARMTRRRNAGRKGSLLTRARATFLVAIKRMKESLVSSHVNR